jgi:hypothetical protein
MVAIFVVGVAFVAMLAASVIGLFGSGIPALDEQCHGREFSCGVVAGVLTAILTLDLRAQQLVADVVVLLNLADRGPTNDDREEALQRAAQSHLPPCMQRGGGRAHLRVNRPLDDPTAGPPGSTCHPDCKMRLCPYPAPGESLSRGELDEAFCRAQQSLLQRSPSSKGRRALRPPWQHAASLSELREFWEQMERRRWR